MKGLVVPDKAERVYNFHKRMLFSLVDMLAAAGIKTPTGIKLQRNLRRKCPMYTERTRNIHGGRY